MIEFNERMANLRAAIKHCREGMHGLHQDCKLAGQLRDQLDGLHAIERSLLGTASACDCIRPMAPVGRTCIKCGGIASGAPASLAWMGSELLPDAQRLLEAWDSSPLLKAGDGRLQECVEDLRASVSDAIKGGAHDATACAMCDAAPGAPHSPACALTHPDPRVQARERLQDAIRQQGGGPVTVRAVDLALLLADGATASDGRTFPPASHSEAG